MAGYTELVLACNLKKHVPQQVIDALKYMIDPSDPSLDLDSPDRLKAILAFDHSLFTQYRDSLSFFLREETYYLPGVPFNALVFDDFAEYYKFTTRAMVKGGEWTVAYFLLWLSPYSETQGFVGYTRFDEAPVIIDLIYFENGEVFYNRTDMYDNALSIKRIKVTLEYGPYPDEG